MGRGGGGDSEERRTDGRREKGRERERERGKPGVKTKKFTIHISGKKRRGGGAEIRKTRSYNFFLVRHRAHTHTHTHTPALVIRHI